MKLSPAEARIHEQSQAPHAWSESDLVQLDPDHPGFRDPAYRARRNHIAKLALQHQDGAVGALAYSDDEEATWRAVWQSLGPLHERLACREYLDAGATVPIDRERIPQFDDINAALARASGFKLKPVAGLVGDRTFLGYLAQGTFLATQYVRHPSRPLYTPEPDVVHELIGHAPTFAERGFARLNREFGRAAGRVDAETLAKVARLYWYTLEFGLVREGSAVKACGAGLLSSFGELGGFAERAQLRDFDPEAIAETPYDPTGYQNVLFVAASFGELCERASAWLAALK